MRGKDTLKSSSILLPQEGKGNPQHVRRGHAQILGSIAVDRMAVSKEGCYEERAGLPCPPSNDNGSTHTRRYFNSIAQFTLNSHARLAA